MSSQTHHRTTFVAAFTATSVIASLLAFAPPAGAAELDGATATAGANATLQLGRDTVMTPNDVLGIITPRLDRIVAMDGGEAHSIAIDRDGNLTTWGSNSRGQLARQTPLSSPSGTPTAVASVIDADAGNEHTAWAESDGDAFVAGSNSNGQQGRLVGSGGATPNQVTYRLHVSDPLTPLGGVSDVAAGRNTSYFVNLDGVWAIGDNRHGQLGNGLVGSSFNPVATKVIELPGGIDQVVAGDGFAAALTAGGDVWTWGDNRLGQLGRDTALDLSPFPARVESLTGIDALVAGDDHLLAADLDTGTIHGFGSNANGQLSSNDTSITSNTLQLVGLSDIAAGGDHSLARTTADAVGHVHSWGSDAEGQLARGGNASAPAAIGGLDDATAIGAGGAHTLVARAPSVVLTPTEVDFGIVEVNAASDAATFTLSNQGPGRVDLLGATSSNPVEFAIAASTCEEGATLDEGDSCSVQVVFAPSAFGLRGSGGGPAVLTIDSLSDTGPLTATMTGIGSVVAGDLTLAVDPPSVAAGPDRVPTDLIPFAADSPDVDAAANDPSLSVPSVPIDALKLSVPSVPIDALKLSVPSVPIDALKLSPAGLGALSSINLAQLALKTQSFDPSDAANWYDLVLARYPGDPITGPLNEVSLAEALDRWPDVFSSLTFGEVDLASSPLGGVTIAGLLLGDVPLAAYPAVQADPDAACAALEAAGYELCGADLTMLRPGVEFPSTHAGLTASVLLLDLTQVDTEFLGLADLALDDIAIALEGSDAQDGYEQHITINGETHPLTFSGAGLSVIPTATIPWNQSSLGKLTAGEVDAELRCSVFDCASPAYDAGLTLAEASAADALAADGTFGHLIASGLPGTSLVDAIITTLLTGDRPAISLDALVQRGLAARGETLDPATYTAVWDNPHDADVTGAELTIDLHQSMWPLAATATATPGTVVDGQFVASGPAVNVAVDATRDAEGRIGVIFEDLDVPADGALAVSIQALAGPREGSVSATATAATPAAPTSAPDPTGPVVLFVDPNHEDNDTPDTATPLEVRDTDADRRSLDRAAGTAMVGGGETLVNQISSGNDVDWFAIPATNSDGSAIDVLHVTNRNKDGVQVAALYYPTGIELEEPLRDPGPGGVVDHAHVHELGMSLTTSEQPLEPDTTPALPGEELGLRLADFSATGSLASDVLIAHVPDTVQPGDHFLLALEAAPDAEITSSVSVISARGLATHVADIPSSRDLVAECDVDADRSAAATFGWPTSLAGADTIYLLDSVALAAADPAGMADLLASLQTLASHPTLGDFVVADIAANPALGAAITARASDPCDVDATNDLVRAINDELDGLGRDASVSVSILGGVDGVPMGWVDDVNPISAGNEITYAASAAVEGADVSLVAGYAAGRYPTDAAYGAAQVFGLRGTYYYPRSLRTARQPGSAAELADALDRLRAADGSYQLSTATAQSTDWMTAFGEAATATLIDAGLTVSAAEHSQSVTDAEVLATIGSADVHVGGLHGAATALFDSAETIIDPASLASAVAGTTLDLAMGPYCHAGTPVEGGVAQALSASTVATTLNSTYGMGIEDGVVLSTRILTNAAGLVDDVANPVDLLHRALADAFLENLEWSTFAAKADMGTIAYGLTAWNNADVTTAEDDPSVGTIVSDPFTGLSSYDLDVDLAAGRARHDTAFGTYWSIDGNTTSRSGGPLQPAWSTRVPVNATGVLWTGGAETVHPGLDLTHQTNQLAGSPANLHEMQAVGIQGPTASVRRHGDRAAFALRAGYATDLIAAGQTVVGDEHLLDEASFRVYVGDPATALQAKPDLIEAVRTSSNTVAFEVEFIDDEVAGNDPALVAVTISETPGAISYVELAKLPGQGDGRTRFAGIASVSPDTDVLAFVQTVSVSAAVHQAPPVKVIEGQGAVGYLFEIVDATGTPLTPTSSGAYVDPYVRIVPEDPSDAIEYSVGAGELGAGETCRVGSSCFVPYSGIFPLDGPDRLVPIRIRVTDNPATEGHHWVLKEGEADQAGPTADIVAPAVDTTVTINEDVDGAIRCSDVNGVDQATVTFRRAGEATPVRTDVFTDHDALLTATPALVTDQVGSVIMTLTCTNRHGYVSDPVSVVYDVDFAEGYGFDSPIQNLPTVNTANAGATLKVQFSLHDASGAVVGTVDDIRSVGTYQLTDENNNPCTGDGASCQDVETRGGDLRMAGDKIVVEVESLKAWACTSRRLVVLLEDDSTMVADFQFSGKGC